PLLQDDTRGLDPPDWQAELEPKLDNPALRLVLGTAGKASRHQDNRLAVRNHDLLVKLVEHHGPAERRRQGGDQETVIPSRRHAANRARGVPAQTVGDNPLALLLRVITLLLVPLAMVRSVLKTWTRALNRADHVSHGRCSSSFPREDNAHDRPRLSRPQRAAAARPCRPSSSSTSTVAQSDHVELPVPTLRVPARDS